MKQSMLACVAVLAGCANGGSFMDDTPGTDAGSKPDTGTMMMMDDSGDPDTGVEDTGPAPCVYPSGPYGQTGVASWLNMTVPQSFSWQGYVQGSSSVGTLAITDLADCDGRNGVNAILVLMSALWCGPCQQEAMMLPGWMQTWGPLGVKVIELVIEDAAHNKATTAAALTWRNQFNLGSIANVVADPNFSFAHGGTNGLPTNVLIDPRTMKVTKVVEGYTGQQDPAVAALAMKNKK